MNFNYSYKSFLITSLLVGNLILLLVSIKLQDFEEEEDTSIPIEYAALLPEEIEIDEVTEKKVQIKTHTAYNEAEQFIKEVEKARNNIESDANAPSKIVSEAINFDEAYEKIKKTKETLAKAAQQKPEEKTVNRKTTISFSLLDRKATYLPNPVYTCNASGKITISIKVTSAGKVEDASYSKTLSTTTNGCLIDAALSYAREARFTSKTGKNLQLGTISYVFPGQN